MSKKFTKDTLPQKRFNTAEVQRLYEEAPEEKVNGKLVKNLETCQAYVTQYLYPIPKGNWFVWMPKRKAMEYYTKTEVLIKNAKGSD